MEVNNTYRTSFFSFDARDSLQIILDSSEVHETYYKDLNSDHLHGGNSKGTTCVVDRDVTAYLVVDRVLRLPTEQHGCRYGGHPGFNDVKVNF